jgi:hypothetical protein
MLPAALDVVESMSIYDLASMHRNLTATCSCLES